VFVKPDSLESESFTAFAAISAHTTTIEARSRPLIQSANRHGLPPTVPNHRQPFQRARQASVGTRQWLIGTRQASIDAFRSSKAPSKSPKRPPIIQLPPNTSRYRPFDGKFIRRADSPRGPRQKDRQIHSRMRLN